MTVLLERELKRELRIEGAPYVVTLAPDGFRLVEKGRRKGLELAWRDLVSGQAALAVALNASLEQMPGPRQATPVQVPARKPARKKRKP